MAWGCVGVVSICVGSYVFRYEFSSNSLNRFFRRPCSSLSMLNLVACLDTYVPRPTQRTKRRSDHNRGHRTQTHPLADEDGSEGKAEMKADLGPTEG